MSDLIRLGQIAGLDQVSAEFQRHVDGKDLPDRAPFLEWCQNILVDHPERRALALPAGTMIRGDLRLELDNDQLAENCIATIVCWGDLTIDGRLINEDSEDGPFLLVAGNFQAAEVIKGGARVVVLGSLTSPGIVFCDDDSGALHIGGGIRCRALIDSDHDVYAVGGIEGEAISDDLGNMRDRLVAQCFEDPDDPQDEWPIGDLIRQRLLAGVPVLK
jgi:hypothetical protein